MPDRLLPLDALARTGGVLVTRPRGHVLHLSLNPTLTPSGRLRRGTGPACGQTRRTWHPASIDGRPLCAHCTRHALRTPTPGAQLLRERLTEPLLVASLTTASTVEELLDTIRLLCHAEPRLTARLSEVVREQRHRLGLIRPSTLVAGLTTLPRTPRLRRLGAWEPGAVA